MDRGTVHPIRAACHAAPSSCFLETLTVPLLSLITSEWLSLRRLAVRVPLEAIYTFHVSRNMMIIFIFLQAYPIAHVIFRAFLNMFLLSGLLLRPFDIRVVEGICIRFGLAVFIGILV